MRITSWRGVLAAGALALVASSGWATVHVGDDFSAGTPGSSINGVGGGVGNWVGNWTGAGDTIERVETPATALEYDVPPYTGPGRDTPGVTVSSPAALVVRGNSDAVAVREFAPLSSDEVLVSFLVRWVGGAPNNNDFIAFWMKDSAVYTIAETETFGINIDRGPGSNEDFFARPDTTPTLWVPAADANVSLGATFFVIVSYRKSIPGGNYDTMEVWVNPDYTVGGSPDLQRPPSLVTTGYTGNKGTFTHFGVRGLALETNDRIELGRFRVSTNWYSVFDDAALFVDLASFSAATTAPGAPVTLTWETSSEIDNVGFNVHRVHNGESVILTSGLIPAEGSEFAGATYTFTDTTVDPSWTELPQYYIEDVDIYGKATFHGPAAYATSGSNANVNDWVLYEY